MLSSAHSPRNRSSRPLEWSGPWPSQACGSSSTSPESIPHFACPETTNSSMIAWAPLTKSPYWPSQSTSVSSAWTLYPYSKPRAAFSESGLLWTSNDARAEGSAASGVNASPVLAS